MGAAPGADGRRAIRLLLGGEPQPLLEHGLHLVGGGAPERETGHVVLDLDLLPVLVHVVARFRADLGGLARGGVRPLEPAADLVPVLVEEDHDRDGLIAVVQERVAQVGVLVAEEHAQVAALHRLADVGDQRRVAMDVAAPVLGEHHSVLHLVDGTEELPLFVGELGLRVVVLGLGPGVAHLGHIVLPRQAFGEAVRVQGDSQLGHLLTSGEVVLPPLYTNPGAEDSAPRTWNMGRLDGGCGRTLNVRPPARRWLIVAALFTVTFGASTPLAAYGVFLPILAETFGWSRGAISTALSINLMVGGLMGIGI